MGSMDEKPNTGDVDNWIKKYKDTKYKILVINLDKDSIMFVTNNGNKKLYTTGNGNKKRINLIKFFKFNQDFEIDNFAIKR